MVDAFCCSDSVVTETGNLRKQEKCIIDHAMILFSKVSLLIKFRLVSKKNTVLFLRSFLSNLDVNKKEIEKHRKQNVSCRQMYKEDRGISTKKNNAISSA